MNELEEFVQKISISLNSLERHVKNMQKETRMLRKNDKRNKMILRELYKRLYTVKKENEHE